MSNVSPSARRKARQRAMQALYQWQLTKQDSGQINAQFLIDQDLGETDVAYFQELINQIPQRCEALSDILSPFLDRPLVQVDPVEKAILLVAAYELLHRSDIPFRVVINEAVELAKRYGADQSHRFINGVLDKVARDLRAQRDGKPMEPPQAS